MQVNQKKHDGVKDAILSLLKVVSVEGNADQIENAIVDIVITVSYTHLTLPTKA